MYFLISVTDQPTTGIVDDHDREGPSKTADNDPEQCTEVSHRFPKFNFGFSGYHFNHYTDVIVID